MLEWLCTALIEASVVQRLRIEKSQCTEFRSGYRIGYRPRRLDSCRDIIAVERMAEESSSSYGVLFRNLKDRSLFTPRLIISDAHPGLVSAIRESFPRQFSTLNTDWTIP